MYNVESSYPTKVDDLIFFSDISYSNKEIEQQHKNLIQQGKYTEASEYLRTQTRITPYSSDLFNLIANRIRAIQQVLIEKKNVMVINQDEPNNSANTHWIEYTE